MPLIKVATWRHRVRRIDEAEHICHAASGHEDAMDILGGPFVESHGGKCKSLVDGIYLVANKRKKRTLSIREGCPGSFVVRRWSQVKVVRLRNQGEEEGLLSWPKEICRGGVEDKAKGLSLLGDDVEGAFELINL